MHACVQDNRRSFELLLTKTVPGSDFDPDALGQLVLVGPLLWFNSLQAFGYEGGRCVCVCV
jgi:hypothetical protein